MLIVIHESAIFSNNFEYIFNVLFLERRWQKTCKVKKRSMMDDISNLSLNTLYLFITDVEVSKEMTFDVFILSNDDLFNKFFRLANI